MASMNWPWNSPAMRRKRADHLADLAQHARQILGPDHDERDQADDQKLSGIEIEHGSGEHG